MWFKNRKADLSLTVLGSGCVWSGRHMDRKLLKNFLELKNYQWKYSTLICFENARYSTMSSWLWCYRLAYGKVIHPLLSPSTLFTSCIKAEGDLCWLFNEVQKLTYIISVSHTLVGKTSNTSITYKRWQQIMNMITWDVFMNLIFSLQ